MADIIRRVVVQGSSTGLTKVTAEIEGVAQAQANLGTASQRTATVVDASSRRMLSTAGSLNALRSSLDAAYRSQQQFARGQDIVNRAFQQGLIDTAEQARLLGLLAAKFDQAGAAAQRMAAANRQASQSMIAGMGAGAADRATQERLRSGMTQFGPNQPVDMIGGMGAVGGPALARMQASEQMIAGMSGQMTRLGQSTRLTSFEVTNLGMQFNDIAVMMASGQNPMVLIMQQGMQVAQIMAMSSVATMGLKAALVAVGASLMTFLTNPLYLAVAAAAAAAAAIMFFGRTFRSEVPPLADTLEEHADLLKRIEQSYKDAAAASQGYGKAVDAESRKVLNFLRLQAERDLRESLAVPTGTPGLPGAGTPGLPTGVPEPTQQFAIGTLQSNQAALAAYTKAVDDLRESARDGSPDIIAFQKALVDFARRFPELRDFAEELIRSLEDLAAAQRTLEPITRDTTDAFESWRSALISLNPLITQLQIAWEQAQKAYEESVRTAKKAAEDAAREAERAAEAAQRELERRAEYIADLRFEQSILNETAEQQEVLNNLRELGAEATAGERAEVDALTRSIFQHNEAMEAWEDATQEAIDRMDEFRDSAKGILSGAIEGGWKGAMDALASRLMGLGEDLVIEGLFGKTGTAGGGLFGSAIQDLLGGVPEKPVAVMHVVAGVVNVGGAGFTLPGLGGNVIVPQGAILPSQGAAPVGVVTSIDLPAAAAAIRTMESGSAAGNYGALGPVTASGDRAYGAYQVMGANVGPWTTQHYGQSLTPQQFLADQAAQDAVFSGQFGSYANKYGLSGAPAAWFGGPGSIGKMGRTDVLGTSVGGYSSQFNQLYGQYAGQPSAGAQEIVNIMEDELSGSTAALNTFSDSIGALQVPIDQAVPGLGSLADSIMDLIPGIFGGGSATPSSTMEAISGGFGGLFQHGGELGAGKWGIAGERGPEIIHGPANVTPMHQGRGGRFNVNIKTEQGVVARVTNAQQNDQGDFDLEIFAQAIEHNIRDKYNLRQAPSRWGRAA